MMSDPEDNTHTKGRTGVMNALLALFNKQNKHRGGEYPVTHSLKMLKCCMILVVNMDLLDKKVGQSCLRHSGPIISNALDT